jgi:hypothetical protein
MCVHHTEAGNERFFAFCEELRVQLAGSELLDPPLAAALELLERKTTRFECEAVHVAYNTEDMHSALGAGVLLSLWNGARARG